MITGDDVEKAIHELKVSDVEIGVARHNAVQLEEYLKIAKAKAYLEAEGSNVKERESRALISDQVKTAIDAYAAAEQRLMEMRMRRETADAIISAWQTQSRNSR